MQLSDVDHNHELSPLALFDESGGPQASSIPLPICAYPKDHRLLAWYAFSEETSRDQQRVAHISG